MGTLREVFHTDHQAKQEGLKAQITGQGPHIVEEGNATEIAQAVGR